MGSVVHAELDEDEIVFLWEHGGRVVHRSRDSGITYACPGTVHTRDQTDPRPVHPLTLKVTFGDSSTGYKSNPLVSTLTMDLQPPKKLRFLEWQIERTTERIANLETKRAKILARLESEHANLGTKVARLKKEHAHLQSTLGGTRRRLMAPGEECLARRPPYRDSPVMLRLLEEIKHDNNQ